MGSLKPSPARPCKLEEVPGRQGRAGSGEMQRRGRRGAHVSPCPLSRLWPKGMLHWSRGKLGAGRFLSKFAFETLGEYHFPGCPQPTWETWPLQLLYGLDGFAATRHAWKQLTVCGTSSQSGEDPAAEAVVVDKRPGVTWSTRGRRRGAGNGDRASQRASTPGPRQEGPPGHYLKPHQQCSVLRAPGQPLPAESGEDGAAVHPQTPALSRHPISCTTSGQVGKEQGRVVLGKFVCPKRPVDCWMRLGLSDWNSRFPLTE